VVVGWMSHVLGAPMDCMVECAKHAVECATEVLKCTAGCGGGQGSAAEAEEARCCPVWHQYVTGGAHDEMQKWCSTDPKCRRDLDPSLRQ
jgi:hypothetical protein